TRSSSSAGCPARLMTPVWHLARTRASSAGPGVECRGSSRCAGRALANRACARRRGGCRTRLFRVNPQPAASAPARRTYSYLGPAGTFTEAALDQVPEARGQAWRPVHNVAQALEDVLEERSDAAMIAIENSVEGG